MAKRTGIAGAQGNGNGVGSGNVAQRLASLISDIDEAGIERMRQAIFDAACGHALFVADGRRPPAGTMEAAIYDHGRSGYLVYVTAPDVAMLRWIVEQNIGKAGTKLAEGFDSTIEVYTAIPGFGPLGDSPPDAPAPVQPLFEAYGEDLAVEGMGEAIPTSEALS